MLFVLIYTEELRTPVEKLRLEWAGELLHFTAHKHFFAWWLCSIKVASACQNLVDNGEYLLIDLDVLRFIA